MPDCKICHKFYFAERHVCSPKWQCCFDYDFNKDEHPDADYMDDSGREVFAESAEKAAVKYCEEYSDFESPDQMVVFVMDDKETSISKYVVDREVVPEFSVYYNYKPEIFILENNA